MNISEFIEKNNIAIVAKADLRNRRFEIIKRDIEVESFDLFEQLILFGNIDNLEDCVEGQLLPRIWSQGNTKCILCKPNEKNIYALFYDSDLDAKEHYFYAKQLNTLLKEIDC